MRACPVCHSRYEDLLRIVEDGASHFRRVVLALQVLAHSCECCGVRYLGNGFHVGSVCYCCPTCAYLASAVGLSHTSG
jgi:hypothetical protein